MVKRKHLKRVPVRLLKAPHSFTKTQWPKLPPNSILCDSTALLETDLNGGRMQVEGKGKKKSQRRSKKSRGQAAKAKAEAEAEAKAKAGGRGQDKPSR